MAHQHQCRHCRLKFVCSETAIDCFAGLITCDDCFRQRDLPEIIATLLFLVGIVGVILCRPLQPLMNTAALDNLRRRLASLRKSRSMTIREVGERAGVSSSTVSRFLTGSPIDADNAIRFGNWFGMTGAEIFGTPQDAVAAGSAAQNIMDGIRQSILADENIPEHRREEFWRWFEMTYVAFTQTKD